MNGPHRPVMLRPGALRALLRQPDLPPDLIAKISERAGDLARAEQARDAAAARAIAWEAVFRRLPVVLLSLLALAVAAGIAYLLSPVPPAAAPEPSTIARDPEDAQPVTSAPALPASAQSEQPVAAAEPAAPPQAPPAGETTPPSPAAPARIIAGQATPAPAASRLPRINRQVRAKASPSRPVVAKGIAVQPSHSAPQSSFPAVSTQPGSGPSAGASETAPIAPVDVPAAVPLIEVPPQP